MSEKNSVENNACSVNNACSINNTNNVDNAPGTRTNMFIPDNYSVQTYLADTNQLLTEINQSLKYLVQLQVNNQEEKQPEQKKGVKVIGIHE